MQIQSVCGGLSAPKLRLSNQSIFSRQFGFGSNTPLKDRKVLGNASSSCLKLGVSKRIEESFWRSLKRGAIRCSSKSDSQTNLPLSGENAGRSNGPDPFLGKSGSVSFYGLTHQIIEEGRIESAPFPRGQGSRLWWFAPVALISSLVLPQFFVQDVIKTFFKDRTVVEILESLVFEALFYIGLAAFFFITDHVQKPYLEFSSKRWSLITGLRGYLSSAFLVMGFKVVIPVLMVYITWPVVGVTALVAVAPFLLGCLAQLLFEKTLEENGSSCWPLITIIFELYRLFQLSKAAYFIDGCAFRIKNLPKTPELYDKNGAYISLIVSFQALGLLCLWSLVTFLVRLFPSRPVSENY